MKKSIISVISISVLLMLTLVGCGVVGDSNQFIDDTGTNTNGGVETFTVIDKDTGCKYVLFTWASGGGASLLLDDKGEPVCESIRQE